MKNYFPERITSSRLHRSDAILFCATALILLLSACATSAPLAPTPAAIAPRSASSSGVAYQDGVAVAKLELPRVNLSGAHRLGNAAAKIGVVEFSDYQCPYCRGFHDQIFPRLKKEYVDTGIVQFIHMDLPLMSIHSQALPAALAAVCAGAQDRFWPMQDALYAHQGELAPALYIQLGRELGLDEKKFRACLADVAPQQAIMRDMAEARRLGIRGTPSFVIGKIDGNVLTVVRLARGAPGFEIFAKEIEKLRQEMNAPATPKTE
jgi:protein-disulfide isomerase